MQVNIVRKMEESFKVSKDDTMTTIYYYQQISDNKEELIFPIPWGGAIIRNNFADGNLLCFKTVKQYECFMKENDAQMWLLLKLRIFRSNNCLFGVYCCSSCESMNRTEILSMDQNPEDILARLCMHSKVCTSILGDWRNIWNFIIGPLDRFMAEDHSNDIQSHSCLEAIDSSRLSVVKKGIELALLYTVTARQSNQMCSLCTRRNCPHVLMFLNHEGNKWPRGEENDSQSDDSDDSTISTEGNSMLSTLPNEDIEELFGSEDFPICNYWVSLTHIDGF